MSQLAIIQASEWQTMRDMAKVLIGSHFLPAHIRDENQVLAIMMRGAELRLPVWTALTHLPVQGGNTPNPDTMLMMALIRRSGLLEDFKMEGNAKTCTVTMKRKGETPHTTTCTIEEATQLIGQKDNWKKQPRTMLAYFTQKMCARTVFQDVLLGMDIRLDSEDEIIMVDDLDEDAPFQPETARVDLDAHAVTPIALSSGAVIDPPLEGEFTEDSSEPLPPPPAAAAPQGMSSVTAASSPEMVAPSTNADSPDAFDLNFPPHTQREDKAEIERRVRYLYKAPAHVQHSLKTHQADIEGMTTDEAVEFFTNLHWNRDKARLTKFAAWAKNVIKLGTPDILAALSKVSEKPLKDSQEWDSGNYQYAQAALVAWLCEYDPAEITKYAAQMKLVDLSADALAIADSVNKIKAAS